MAQIVKLRRSSVSGQKPTNSNLQLGELALNTSDGKVYMSKSGSLGPSVEELISTNTVNTGSLHLVGSITASAFSGSASGLINVPFQISGSDLGGNTYNKQFTKLQFDDSTGLNVSESAPGTAFVSIGSHFKDIFVSGSPLLSATGSDAFEVIGVGGLGISTSITDTNGNGYIKELKKNGKFDVKSFFLRRAFRILPVVFLFSLVLLLIDLIYGIGISLNSYLSGLFFYKQLTNFSDFWFNAHLWSLSVEEQFYIIFPSLLFVFGSKTYLRILFIFLITIPIFNILHFNDLVPIGIFHNTIAIFANFFGLSTYLIIIGSLGAIFFNRKPAMMVFISKRKNKSLITY